MNHTRFRRYYGTGAIYGKILCIIICVDIILLAILDYFFPREEIDLAPKFGLQQWQEVGILAIYGSIVQF